MNENKFDTFIEQSVTIEDVKSVVKQLFATFEDKPELIVNRALSLKLLLASNFDLFNEFFSTLDAVSSTLPGGQKFSLDSGTYDEILTSFNDNFDVSKAEVDRLESRKRIYIDGAKAESIGKLVLNNSELKAGAFKVNKVLLERKTPNYLITNNLLNWHIDNLRDEFKIFVPLDNVCESNGPMLLIEDSHVFSSLSIAIKDHLLSVFKLVGSHTSILNNFDRFQINDFVEQRNRKIKSILLNQGEAYFFNTRSLHTGSENISKCRDSVTIYLEHSSVRNEILKFFDKL